MQATRIHDKARHYHHVAAPRRAVRWHLTAGDTAELMEGQDKEIVAGIIEERLKDVGIKSTVFYRTITVTSMALYSTSCSPSCPCLAWGRVAPTKPIESACQQLLGSQTELPSELHNPLVCCSRSAFLRSVF